MVDKFGHEEDSLLESKFFTYQGKRSFKSMETSECFDELMLLNYIKNLQVSCLVIIANLPVMLMPEWEALNCVILHGGKVPEYRGASVINWQMINGEKTIGLSALRLSDTLDGGRVLTSHEIKIGNQPLDILRPIIDVEFVNLVEEVSQKFAAKQDLNFGVLQEDKGHIWPKRRQENSQIFIDELSFRDLVNFINAHEREYASYIYHQGQKLFLFGSSSLADKSYQEDNKKTSVEIYTDYVEIKCLDGCVIIDDFKCVQS